MEALGGGEGCEGHSADSGGCEQSAEGRLKRHTDYEGEKLMRNMSGMG